LKSLGLGIGILLFAILLSLTGLNFAALIIGVVGLGFVFEGYLSKPK
jgi:hypothetical protein